MAQLIHTEKYDLKATEAAVLEVLDDFQASDIVKIDLPSSCGYADSIIIATGRSSRQIGAIADKIKKRIAPHLNFNIQIEGLEKSEWVLIDIGYLIVHVFNADMRAFYQLEKLWLHD